MRKKIGITVTLLLVLYAFWNGRNLILGPRISVTSPHDGESFQESLVTITGVAKNVAFISLNGRQIFIDPHGTFTEDIALLPGYNVLELRGRDRFGKETTKQLRLYSVAQSPPSPELQGQSTTTNSVNTE